MTDTHGVTPEGGAQSPKPGEEHAQHAASANQQPSYQQTAQQPSYQQTYQQSPYQAPVQPQGYRAPAPVSVERKSHGVRTFLLAFCGAALACVIGLGGFAIWQAATGSSGGSSDDGQHTQLGAQSSGSVDAGDEDPTLAEAVAKKALPSVAAIDVYTNQSSMGGLYGYGYGSGANSGADSNTLTQSSLGSGVVLTEDGYIITNNHVVEGADALKVTVGGEQYDAEIVGTDPSSDLAVIKAKDASGLAPIEVGDSDELIIGEWVMTIGSPFGLEQSVATGIVSATSRSQIMDSGTDPFSGQSAGEPTIYANLIQTDAAINPGNSGGALVNEYGQVVGINSNKVVSTYYEGIGFAIPISDASNIISDLMTRGYVSGRSRLGIMARTVTEIQADASGIPVGVLIVSVNDDSPLKGIAFTGDIITEAAGQKISTLEDLYAVLRTHSGGESITVTVYSPGSSETPSSEKQYTIVLLEDTGETQQ